MSTFCQNNKPNTSGDNLYNLLEACDTNVRQTKNTGYDFRSVFNQDPDNSLLSSACGIPNNILVYSNNQVNTAIKTINIDQTTFYNFWGNTQQVNDFASRFRDLYTGINTTGDTIINSYYENLNNLIINLLLYFLCTTKDGNNPILQQNDPQSGVLNNWRFFLANNRGTASNFVCEYCLVDYFIPSVGDKKTSAGKIVRQLLSNNPFLQRWCGCCVPQEKNSPSGYDFTNPFLNKTTAEKFSLNCEPICNNPDTAFGNIYDNTSTIPLINGNSKYVNAPIDVTPENLDYDIALCSNTICVIDNITINTIASQGGGINFNQVCPGCTSDPGKCTCYSYGQDVWDKVKAGKSGMQDPTVFKQYCPNAACFQEQIDGSYKEVQCNSVNPGNTGKGHISNYNGTGVFNDFSEADIYGVDTWLFPISLLVIFIILFLGAIYVTIYRNRVVPRMRHENQ